MERENLIFFKFLILWRRHFWKATKKNLTRVCCKKQWIPLLVLHVGAFSSAISINAGCLSSSAQKMDESYKGARRMENGRRRKRFHSVCQTQKGQYYSYEDTALATCLAGLSRNVSRMTRKEKNLAQFHGLHTRHQGRKSSFLISIKFSTAHTYHPSSNLSFLYLPRFLSIYLPLPTLLRRQSNHQWKVFPCNRLQYMLLQTEHYNAILHHRTYTQLSGFLSFTFSLSPQVEFHMKKSHLFTYYTIFYHYIHQQ